MSDPAHTHDAPQATDPDAIGARLARLPTADLLEQLEAILAAIDSSVPERQRRRSGFFGRLLARDLVAQAQPDDVATRVRLHLATAHDIAERLSIEAVQLDTTAPKLRERARQLRAFTVDTTGPDDPQRRVALAATWDTAAAHVELVLAHARQLLRRHAQVRDVLVPAWRQQMALTASDLRGGHDQLDQTLSEQIAAFRGSLPAVAPLTGFHHDIRHDDPTLAHRDAQPQEPSP